MQGIPRSALIADDAQPLLPLLVDLRLEARLIQLGIRIVRLSAIGGIAPRIDGIRLLYKEGGKSGVYEAEE